MDLLDLMDGCLDAGDMAGVAAVFLAHPSSQRLDHESIRKLFAIGFGGAEVRPVDAAMLRLLATVAHIDDEAAR